VSRLRAVLRWFRARWAIAELLIVVHTLRVSRRRLGVAVVYHRVDRVATDPARHLVPALSTAVFRRQLTLLKVAFQFVPASQLAPAVRSRRRGERIPLAITFDDDLECHARVSAPLLSRVGASATFFVCGADLNAFHGYWWDHLQAAVDRGAAASVLGGTGIPRSVATAWAEHPGSIHSVAEAIKRLDPDARDELARRLASVADSAGGRAQTLPTDGIRALVRSGFEIGFHTVRHDYLLVLDDDRLADALTAGREQLEDVVGHPLVTIAYPHGGADGRVAEAARAAGYIAGFTTQGDAIESGQDELLMGRVECSYGSAAELAARIQRALRRAGSRRGD
jgi:peptidoglycan/xylan/chitin deacetylase (PgdA/CDA1 family)